MIDTPLLFCGLICFEKTFDFVYDLFLQIIYLNVCHKRYFPTKQINHLMPLKNPLHHYNLYPLFLLFQNI